MWIGYSQACACATYCCESAKQSLVVTVITANKILGSPEAAQKAFIVALSIIRGLGDLHHTHYLPHLISVLDTAPAFDFYGFCRLPRLFLYPYHMQSLDEYAILDQLEVILCDNWHLGKERDPLVYQYAKEQLTAFLERIAEVDQDFATEEEVKTVLLNWFKKTLEANPTNNFDPHNLNFEDLKINLKPTLWIESLINYIFIAIDIANVPDFLSIWGVIDLAPLSNALGSLPLLSSLPQHALGDYVWRGMCAGFLLQFLNAIYSLWKENLTPSEVKDAKWLLVASAAECLYSLSNIQKRDPKLINCLALIAKSLGLIAFLVASKPTFFNDG